jgi:hypothetical protein
LLRRGACHRAGHFGPDPLAPRNDEIKIRSRDVVRSSFLLPLPSGEREPSTEGARRVRGNRPRNLHRLIPLTRAFGATSPHWGEVKIKSRSRDALRARVMPAPLEKVPPSTIASRLNRRWDRPSARSCFGKQMQS